LAAKKGDGRQSPTEEEEGRKQLAEQDKEEQQPEEEEEGVQQPAEEEHTGKEGERAQAGASIEERPATTNGGADGHYEEDEALVRPAPSHTE